MHGDAARGLELVTMRERAELLGGTIEFLNRREAAPSFGCGCRPPPGLPHEREPSRCCSSTITRSYGAAFVVFSRTTRDRASSAKRATPTKPSAWRWSSSRDVVVMDCAMPGANGLAATKAILERLPARPC